MTALLKKEKSYTPKEYLKLEETAEYRSEYDDGKIVAMAGSSLNHARIISNIDRKFAEKVKKSCESLTSEIKVWVENYQRFYYPDVLVFCDEPSFYEERDDTITNPVLIVEVLSDSTEAKDRGEKMLAYRTLEHLEEYILVSQSKPIVEQYTKTANSDWIHKATIGLKSVIKFESIEITLGLESIYQRIEFKEK